MSAGKHTPGPWHTGTTESTKYMIYSQLGFCIANSFNGVFVDAACEANARRIVACVNACEGFSIEELEGADLFKDSIESGNLINELLEALKETTMVLDRIFDVVGDAVEPDSICGRARAAIAKAEGGAA